MTLQGTEAQKLKDKVVAALAALDEAWKQADLCCDVLGYAGAVRGSLVDAKRDVTIALHHINNP